MLEKYGVVTGEEDPAEAKEKDLSVEDLAKMQRRIDRENVISESPKGTKIGPTLLPGKTNKKAKTPPK